MALGFDLGFLAETGGESLRVDVAPVSVLVVEGLGTEELAD